MNIKEFKNFCENTPLVVHNSIFESKWLMFLGIDPNIVHDTLLLAYLYDERLPLDLESLCLRFNVDSVFKEEYGTDVSILSGDRLVERNIRDARNTKVLKDILWGKLTDKEKYLYTTTLLPATKTIAEIENNGVCYSPHAIEDLKKEIDKKVLDLDLDNDPVIKEFEKVSEKKFNINSWIHRGIIIYDLLGYQRLPYKQALTDSGSPSTSSKVIKKMLERRHTDTLDKIIQFSSLEGWKENYESIEKFCESCGSKHVINRDGRDFVLTNLRMAGTTTGRIKSDHPNMQNNPSRAGGWTRKIFVPRSDEGLIVEADYDGIELRLLAGLSKDERLLEDFVAGKDPHVEMARLALGKQDITEEERNLGKTLNFAIPFGAGINRLSFEMNTSYGQAKTWVDRYWKQHKTLKKYLNNIPESGIVMSPTGMKRHTDTWMEGKNFPLQNSALVVLLTGLNNLVPAVRDFAPVDLTIHDSVRMDLLDKNNLDKLVKVVKENLEFEPEELYSWLPIPLTVSIKFGRDWGSMEEIKI